MGLTFEPIAEGLASTKEKLELVRKTILVQRSNLIEPKYFYARHRVPF
jgi:hypothetical protein